MDRIRTRIIGSSALLIGALFLSPPTEAAAQGGPGFLFKRPNVTVKFETGYGLRLANSDVFDFTREQLTVSKHDFSAPYVGGEFAVRVSERADLGVSFGFSKSRKLSEFRDWVDGDDNAIEQETTLRTTPFLVTGRYYFEDRGRSIGRFAWVPNTVTPYVGAGVGVVSYRFEQEGDFVDFETFDIFFDRFTSAGQTGLFRLLGGVSVSLGRQFEVTGEARYSYASDEMGSDFDGFDPLSLSGFEGVVGIGLRF